VLSIEDFAWRNMAMYLVFFLAGCHLAGGVKAAAAAVTPSRAIALVVVWLLALGGAATSDLLRVPGVLLVVSVLAVAAGVAVSTRLTDRVVGRQLRRLGQKTIDVYLPHVMIIGGMTWLIAATGVEVPPRVGALLVPVLAVAAVLLSLLVSSGLQRAGATWLFSLPGRLAYRPIPSGAAPRS
jgi:peptidoglycan/LPS O-acetylase OafA/YrhL